MSEDPRLRRLGLVQALGALALLGLCAGVLGRTCTAAETVYLSRDGEAAWIQAPLPVRRGAWAVDPGRSPSATFETTLTLDRPPADATLEIAAWSRVRVELNGVALGELDGVELAGETRRIALGGRLREGRNRIRVEVRHLRGPPLLRARITGIDPAVATGPGWLTRFPRRGPANAVRADDTRMPGAFLSLPGPAAGLAARGLWIGAAFLLGAGAWLARAKLPGPPAGRGAALALVALAIVWSALFVRVQLRVPLWAGPDAVKHIEVVRWIAREGSLPRADEAWSAYHPPLFYALAALPQTLLTPVQDGFADRALLRLLPALATLGNVLLAALLAARFLGDASRGARLAAAFAAAAPANLLLATYVSNESLHGLLSNAAITAAVLAILAGRPTTGRVAAVGLLVGLAALAKATSLLLVPVLAFFVGFSAWLADGRGPARALGAAALLAGVALLLCGGWLLHNHALYGQWLLWNHAIPGGEHFWQEPGFRTLAYYTGFGEALRHPYAAAFHSFGDALYVTFFGDGGTAGVADAAVWRTLWDEHALGAAYALALPAAACAGLGGLLLLLDAFRGDDPRRRIAATLLVSAVFVIGFALLQRSLAFPYYSFVKGSFALGVLAPLAVAAGRGLDAAHRALARVHAEWGPALLYGWLAAWCAALLRGLWG